MAKQPPSSTVTAKGEKERKASEHYLFTVQEDMEDERCGSKTEVS